MIEYETSTAAIDKRMPAGLLTKEGDLISNKAK